MIDPEKCCRAFGKLSIVMQLTKVLQQETEVNGLDPTMYQRTLIIIQTIACHEFGAELILNETNLIRIMCYLIGEGICRENIANIWSHMASHYYGIGNLKNSKIILNSISYSCRFDDCK